MKHLKHLKKKMSWFNYKGLFVSNIYHANILLFICCLSILTASVYIYSMQMARTYAYSDSTYPLNHPPVLRGGTRMGTTTKIKAAPVSQNGTTYSVDSAVDY